MKHHGERVMPIESNGPNTVKTSVGRSFRGDEQLVADTLAVEEPLEIQLAYGPERDRRVTSRIGPGSELGEIAQEQPTGFDIAFAKKIATHFVKERVLLRGTRHILVIGTLTSSK
jgi:hypothetical protein